MSEKTKTCVIQFGNATQAQKDRFTQLLKSFEGEVVDFRMDEGDACRMTVEITAYNERTLLSNLPKNFGNDN